MFKVSRTHQGADIINGGEHLKKKGRKMMMAQVVWNKEWIRPYESSWSIFEKFSYANLVKKTPILKSYGSKQVKHIKNSLIGGTHRGLIYLNGFDTELLSEALDYDIKQHLDQLLCETITILPDDFHWFHGNLKWCDECLQYGYHSILHQFVLLHHCPFHLKPLTQHCPNCNETFPYMLSDKISFFTCECGYRFADLSGGWSKWRLNPTTILCPLMKCWLRLNSQIQKSRLIFLPEYALQNNKALALLIQAFKESNNDLNNEEEEIITKKYNSYHRNWKVFNTPFIEMSYPIKDYSVRSIYRNQVEFEEYYSYFYEQSRQIFKSVDQWIRNENIDEHRHCIKRFHGVLKEVNKPFPPICPHAYAYVLWKQSLLGINKFYKHRMGAYKKRNLESFNLITRFFVNENGYIFGKLIENISKLRVDRPWEIVWILNNLTATFTLSLYRVWEDLSVSGANEMLSPSLDLLESLVKKQMPFFVIRVSTEEDDQPIAILKYNSKVQENRKLVNCKSKLRINNKIEKWHEPIAYSMRYFDSEKGYPANYKEEQRYIDKYVRNINAPIKYSEL